MLQKIYLVEKSTSFLENNLILSHSFLHDKLNIPPFLNIFNLIIMEVLLDTNFVIACVKNKIDFIEELRLLGFRVLVPREVIEELKDLRLQVTHDSRVAIDLAIVILLSKGLEKVRLGKQKVDEGLIAKGKKGAYIATLDVAIKRLVPNRVTISAAKNSLQVERT